jgi:mRNA-degrading endonuclease RelE of RelBE toxin-antitoxin system
LKAVSFTPAAIRQWRKLSVDIRQRIDAKLMTYAKNGSGREASKGQ